MKELIGPRRQAPRFNVGKRWTRWDVERYGNGIPVSRRDKLARRVLRQLLHDLESPFEAGAAVARRNAAAYTRYATNSHEAKRYVQHRRAERKRERLFPAWINMWAEIGAAVSKLNRFVKDDAQ